MKMIIFALLVLVAVLVLLLLRKYTRLEFVGHAALLQIVGGDKLIIPFC
ncbi:MULTISPECIES: hypothetical protein [Klebsiella]|nr:hypothetical protein [Klebsiella pneumoniae]MCF6871637.1 hypothetical protein [Klebsiella pneumoniae]MCF6994217.1 hypothetical protein [Klebsiella pneumoniae]MCJ4762952.1 hypothetical protein [Klebsiella pneumoniae]MCM2240018.1 hypothetical protein [Klebsiella pneumoniae]MCN9538120.1 hypothetical protein [Klebsiella pneumoniae]